MKRLTQKKTYSRYSNASQIKQKIKEKKYKRVLYMLETLIVPNNREKEEGVEV